MAKANSKLNKLFMRVPAGVRKICKADSISGTCSSSEPEMQT